MGNDNHRTGKIRNQVIGSVHNRASREEFQRQDHVGGRAGLHDLLEIRNTIPGRVENVGGRVQYRRTEITEIVCRGPRLGPISLAIVIMVANRGLVVNSVTRQNIDGGLGLLPLSLPVRRRSLCASTTYVAIAINRITASIDD